MTSPDPKIGQPPTWNYFTFADCETSRLSFLLARSSSVPLTPLSFRANYFSALFSPSFARFPFTHLNLPQNVFGISFNLLEIYLQPLYQGLEEYLENISSFARLIQIVNLRLDLLRGSKLAWFASLFWCKRIYSKSHVDETAVIETRISIRLYYHVYLRGISIDWFGDCTVQFSIFRCTYILVKKLLKLSFRPIQQLRFQSLLVRVCTR